MGTNGSSVSLEFRRLGIKPVNHFQNWIPLTVPTDPVSVELRLDGGWQVATFLPFIAKRGDQGSHYYEDMSFESLGAGVDELRVDDGPFGKDRGFFSFGSGMKLENVSQAQIEALQGRLASRVTLKKGDVIAARLENFYDKTVMVMRVDDYVPGKMVRLTIRYLYRGKTAYSDDKD